MKRLNTTNRLVAICLGATFSLAACGSSTTSTETSGVTQTSAATESTDEVAAPVVDSALSADVTEATDVTSGVRAAKWSSNVKISFGDSTFTFESDGLPSHELPDQFLVPDGQPSDPNTKFAPQDTKSFVKGSAISVDIPLKPEYSSTVTKTSLGQIGVMISGAQLFNDYEDPQLSVVAVDDNKTVTPVGGAYFLDACNGHPLMSGADYHYHGVPYCITDTVDVAGEHSRIIGFVRDGFPVYGPQNTDGSKLANADLDECSGHTGPTPEFPTGIYHYHLTDDAAPYSLDCYHGVVAATNGGGPGNGGGPPNGGPPDGGPPNRGPQGNGG